MVRVLKPLHLAVSYPMAVADGEGTREPVGLARPISPDVDGWLTFT